MIMLEEGGVGDTVSPAICKFPEEFDLLMCGRRYGSFASWCTSNRSSFRYAKQRLIKALASLLTTGLTGNWTSVAFNIVFS